MAIVMQGFGSHDMEGDALIAELAALGSSAMGDNTKTHPCSDVAEYYAQLATEKGPDITSNNYAVSSANYVEFGFWMAIDNTHLSGSSPPVDNITWLEVYVTDATTPDFYIKHSTLYPSSPDHRWTFYDSNGAAMGIFDGPAPVDGKFYYYSIVYQPIAFGIFVMSRWDDYPSTLKEPIGVFNSKDLKAKIGASIDIFKFEFHGALWASAPYAGQPIWNIANWVVFDGLTSSTQVHGHKEVWSRRPDKNSAVSDCSRTGASPGGQNLDLNTWDDLGDNDFTTSGRYDDLSDAGGVFCPIHPIPASGETDYDIQKHCLCGLGDTRVGQESYGCLVYGTKDSGGSPYDVTDTDVNHNGTFGDEVITTSSDIYFVDLDAEEQPVLGFRFRGKGFLGTPRITGRELAHFAPFDKGAFVRSQNATQPLVNGPLVNTLVNGGLVH